MKAFSNLLQDINQGSTHSAITADMAELLKTVQATGRSGSLTVKLTVSPATKNNSGTVDKINVAVDRKLALPKPQEPNDFFYLTDDGETTRNHPRQQELPGLKVADSAPLQFKEA